jgi:hypothetical protein
MKIKISSSPFSGLVFRGSISKRFFFEFYQFNLSLKQFLISFVLLLFLIPEASAQNFFPLKVGNAYQVIDDWYWNVGHFSGSGTDYQNSIVQSDTLINELLFYKFSNNFNYYPPINYDCLYRYDSLNQKLFVKTPYSPIIRLAVDFNTPLDSQYVSYINGEPINFISQGLSYKIVMGDTQLVYSMKHPQEDNIPLYIYEFSANIGLSKYKEYAVTTNMLYSHDQNIVAAIIDSLFYNQLILRVDSLYPVEDRPLDTFPYLLTISYTASYSALIDSFYLDVQHLRADTLVQTKKYNISTSNPHISFNLAGKLSGDKIKFRATITDTSIFYNVAHYPDTGWVVINVLPPILSVENENNPLSFNLAQNYPNPFNPITTISYQIPAPAYVTINVYDVLGNEIEILISEEKNAGSYDIGFDGSKLTSGIYYYRISAGEFSQTKKMILLK